MIQGKGSTKLNDGLGKTTEKNIPKKDCLKNKELPEKAKFTTQYHSVNNKGSKIGDKALGSPRQHEAHTQGSNRPGLARPKPQNGPEKLCKDPTSMKRQPTPAIQKYSEGRKIISPTFSSIPSFRRAAAIPTSTSVSCNKVKNEKKIPVNSDLKKIPIPRVTHSTLPVNSRLGRNEALKKPSNPQTSNKTETKLNVRTPATLKKPTVRTAVKEVKEEGEKKPQAGSSELEKNPPLARLPAVASGSDRRDTNASTLEHKAMTNRAALQNRSLEKVETHRTARVWDRSRSCEMNMNRVSSKRESTSVNRNPKSKTLELKSCEGRSQEKGLVHDTKDLKLGVTGENSTTQNAPEHVCNHSGVVDSLPADGSGNTRDSDVAGQDVGCTSEGMRKKEVNRQNNETLHVCGAAAMVADESAAGNEAANSSADPSAHDYPPPKTQEANSLDFSSALPIQNYDSFESVGMKNYGDGLLNLDKKIWCNSKARTVVEKTDYFSEFEDDSSDSLAEFLQHSWASEDEPETKVKKSEMRLRREANENDKEREKGKTADREWKWRQPNDAVKLRPEDEIAKGKKLSLRGKSRESMKDPNVKKFTERTGMKTNRSEPEIENSVKDTQEVAPRERRIHFQGSAQHKMASEQVVGSGFFKTHANIGFIGKDVDEEFVSFELGQVALYQPHESQMLFYDIANCTATQAYLKMCGINFNLVTRKNAEDMSPSGKVPFISSGLCIIPEFEAIVSFLQFKKFACIQVEEHDKPTFRTLISMIANTLEQAERYICWYDNSTISKYTKPRVGGHYPFPLNHIIHWKKGFEERKRLAGRGMDIKTFDKVLREVDLCFKTLSEHLGSNNFFFGNASTEIDALIYGHIYALFTADVEGPFRDIQFIVQQFPNLITFAVNFDKVFSLHKLSEIDQTYWDRFLMDSKS